MPEKLRVFESELKTGKVQDLKISPKRGDSARDGALPQMARGVPLTRELILRLIELIKKV